MKTAGLPLCMALLMLLAAGPVRGGAEIHVPGQAATIQAAVDIAVDGDEIVIADGVYTGPGNRNIDPGGKAVTIRSENGAAACIIDCEYLGRGFWFHTEEGPDTVLRGITIRNGYFRGAGGGIACVFAGPVIEDCVVECCRAHFHGGGLDVFHSAAVIRRCEIRDNYSGNWGGGLSSYGSPSPWIYQCDFHGNSARLRGGGLAFESSLSTLADTNVHGNSAPRGGGIFYLSSIEPVSVNCRVFENSVDQRGGGIYIERSRVFIQNFTVADNTASESGGGIYCERSYAVVTAGIIWGNTAPRGSGVSVKSGDSIAGFRITYTTIQDGQDGIWVCPDSTLFWDPGNLSGDPLFTAGPGGAYCLGHTAAGQPGDSPCIDTGRDPAGEVCYTLPQGTACMDAFSTRTDGVADTGIVDQGGHY